MNEKVTSLIQKAQQERKRGQFERALKRIEQGIAAHPDELDLYLEAIDTALEGGELVAATNLLKTVQDKFSKDRERVVGFIREKLQTVHDASLARCVVEHAVKRRELESALTLLENVPDHTIRELLNRARTKAQTLKSATHGGYTVGSEGVTNELISAVLSVRLGNLKEAVTTFVSVVEEKPGEHKMMDPFLAALVAKHAKSGRVRYARACSLRAGGNEIEAIQHFVEGARIEPACADNCVEQLRAMLENPRHPGKIRRALAEALLLKGDMHEAAQTLREYLAENPENGREVIMLLRPFIESATSLNDCTWLAVDQALGLEQSSVALELLRGIHQRGNHNDELYAWMEGRANAEFLPTDVKLFHASLALEQKQFERAAEILAPVCVASSQDVPGILSMIDRHRSSHPALDALYQSHAPKDAPVEATESVSSGEDDFQSFEASEFRLETSARRAPALPKTGDDKAKPRFNSSPFSSSGKKDDGGKAEKPARESFTGANELSFDDDGVVQRPQEDDVVEVDATMEDAVEADAVEPDAPVQSEDGDDAMKPVLPVEITEEHVTNVAQQLYLAGATAFFHIDAGAESVEPESTTVEAATPAAPAEATPAPATPAPVATATPTDASDSEELEPFAARFAKFSAGELSNTAILVMLDEAVRDGHVDELHELLYFEPETGEEHFARYYFQAEYHLLCNRPLQALEILARLDMPGLDDNNKQRVWYKIAVAQRMTHNFAGAGTTLDRLLQHFPGREDVVRLKRRNQEQFIEDQSLAATTLEKTSALD